MSKSASRNFVWPQVFARIVTSVATLYNEKQWSIFPQGSSDLPSSLSAAHVASTLMRRSALQSKSSDVTVSCYGPFGREIYSEVCLNIHVGTVMKQPWLITFICQLHQLIIERTWYIVYFFPTSSAPDPSPRQARGCGVGTRLVDRFRVNIELKRTLCAVVRYLE